MNKVFFIMVFLLSALQLSAQPEFFNDSLRKKLGDFLVQTKQWEQMQHDPNLEALISKVTPNNIGIINLLSNFDDDVRMVRDTTEYGIYSFRPAQFKAHSKFYLGYINVFLKSGNQYEILQIKNKDLGQILDKLIDYFYRHQEVNKTLLPDYVIAVCQVYKDNTDKGAVLVAY